jgi:hypothetical protein
MFGGHFEFVVAQDAGEEAIDLFMGDIEHLTALPADQVVVKIILDDLVDWCARAQVGDRYPALAGEEIQRTVHGGLAQRGKHGFYRFVDLLGGPVFVILVESLQDDGPGGSQSFGHSSHLQIFADAIVSDDEVFGKRSEVI